MRAIEKLKLDIKFFHQRMLQEPLLNAEKLEQPTGEIKDRLLQSRKRLQEAMAKNWSDAQIIEKEKARIQTLPKDVVKL